MQAGSSTDALLASFERYLLTECGSALIITLLRLGLRRSEVATLRLDDIDWRAIELPAVGRALGRTVYRCPPMLVRRWRPIRGGAPASNRREVFLRATAPRPCVGRGDEQGF